MSKKKKSDVVLRKSPVAQMAEKVKAEAAKAEEAKKNAEQTVKDTASQASADAEEAVKETVSKAEETIKKAAPKAEETAKEAVSDATDVDGNPMSEEISKALKDSFMEAYKKQTEGELEDELDDNVMILCENLVKIYKTKETEVLALQGLELRVEKGEFIAIIGSSGSGKSTFLNLLGGLDRPSAGKLYVDGKNLFKMTESQLVSYKQKTVGFVWQNNARNLLPYLTAIQNVELPMLFCEPKERHQRALDLLTLVGMAHKKDSKLNQLSGGEQQRIAIAIALANRPKLLLADEPTGSVDQKTSDAVLDVFRKLNSELGITIVIVTHDINLAKKVNRVVMMRDGKTSIERIMKEEFVKEQLHGFIEEDTHEEYAILDHAGRVQIPREMLDEIGVDSKKIRMTVDGDKIVITKA